MKRVFVAIGLLPCLLLVSCDETWLLAPPASQDTSPTPVDTGTGGEIIEPGDVPAPVQGGVPTGTGSTLLERLTEQGVLELGIPGAPELSVYTNLACTYCAEFTREYLPRLQRDFIEKGLLRVSIHIVPFKKYPNSSAEAAGIYCASKRGKGLAMHLTLLALKTRTRDAVIAAGKEHGITQADMRSCLDDQLTKNAVALDEQLSAANGITLVPAFAINGELQTGLPSYADLRGWVESELTQ